MPTNEDILSAIEASDLPRTGSCEVWHATSCTGRGTLMANPLDLDLRNRIVLMHLCPPCARESARDV